MLPSANSAVFSFLAEALLSVNIKNRVETYVHEFEDCRYFLCRSKADPDLVGLSFKYSYPFTHAARLALIDAYQGFATIDEQSEPDFQVTLQVRLDAILFWPLIYNFLLMLSHRTPLQVSLPALRDQEEQQRQLSIEKLASIRLYITGAALR